MTSLLHPVSVRGLSRRLSPPVARLGLGLGLLLAAAFVSPRPAIAQSQSPSQPQAQPLAQQFAVAPAARPHEAYASDASDLQQYRRDVARHLYEAYPQNVHKGKLPPLMYAVTMVETDVDQDGQVTGVRFVREPAAAKEVMPWIRTLIQQASPYPAPLGLHGTQTFVEVWLVNRNGQFQLHTLSEGQASSSQHARAD